MDANGYKRLLVLHMRGQGRSNKEISEALGYSASYVTELV
jgi:DNA-binding CsgD family transcriptional regulator